MRSQLYGLIFASALIAAPQLAFADETGAVGGAVTGAIVGGPVGAVVGGVVGGVVTGPPRNGVVVQPEPCHTRTTQTTNSDGSSSTTQSTNCAN